MAAFRAMNAVLNLSFKNLVLMVKPILLFFLLFFSIRSLAQVVPKGIQVNEQAPNFVTKDQNGRKLVLSEELKKGPVVLVFYRGQWCPYCSRQLKKLEDSLSFIRERGATLIAITPEIPENISKTIQKTKASYPIVYDEGLRIMRSYDVSFTVDSNTVVKYRQFGIDFNAANGNNGANLPVPALYIVNTSGKIIFRHFDPDYKQRVSVREVLGHL